MYRRVARQSAPFDDLKPDTFEWVMGRANTERFPAKEYVFRQGDKSLERLFFVVEGLAEVIVVDEAGKEFVVGIRKPGDFFGETGILAQENYAGSVRTVEPLVCLTLANKDFEHLLYSDISFSSFFSRILTQRTRSLYEELYLEHTHLATGLDSRPFRKKLSELMSAPVVTCSEEDTVDKVVEKMVEANISAIIVLSGKEIAGIITERDLVIKAVATAKPVAVVMAKEVMAKEVITLPPDAFFYEGLLAMVRNRNKHVVVFDQDSIKGIVTLRDLVKARSSGALTIVDRIETEETLEALNVARRDVDNVLKALFYEKAPIPEICEVITELNDRLTRKIVTLAEQEMVNAGFGKPPVEYCFILMGSGGRQEQLFRTDQDNGIIYNDEGFRYKTKLQNYFLLLGEKIVSGLEFCGFKRCNGKVMANNPKWCRPLSVWSSEVEHWMLETEGQKLRDLTIFLDFRAVYGSVYLADKLQQFTLASIKRTPVVLRHLARDDIEHGVPINILGHFITEKKKEHRGELNLKTSACVHIVDSARIFSLRESIVAKSTFVRIKQLAEKGILSKDDGEILDTAYQSLMMFRLRENLAKTAQGGLPNNYVNPAHLSKRERAVLKDAYWAVKNLQQLTAQAFQVRK